MSKITDILERFRVEQEAGSRQTVTQFAEGMDKAVDLILEQFAEAGVKFSGAEDLVLEEHKEKLLSWLRCKHFGRSEEGIKVQDEYSSLPFFQDWMDVAACENGAEWDCLSRFFGAVVLGHEINPYQQRLINLIVAKSFLQGGLPLKRVGRPKESRTDELAMRVAEEYWAMIDGGLSAVEVVNHLSSKFHKTERQIFRYIEVKRHFFGATREERDQKRLLFQMVHRVVKAHPGHFADLYKPQTPDLSSLKAEDYLDHLDELIAKEAKNLPDINGLNIMVSDKGE